MIPRDVARLYFTSTLYSQRALATWLGSAAGTAPEKQALGLATTVGAKYLVITLDDSLFRVEPTIPPPTTSPLNRGYWLPNGFSYMQRNVPDDTDDYRLLTAKHTIQAMLAFIRRHGDNIVGVDCTKADSDQRYAVEDFYHVEALTPRLFRAPIGATTKRAIDATMQEAEEIRLDSLAQLRPIDVRRYLGVVFRENVSRTMVERLLDANYQGTEDLFIDRQTLSNITTLSELIARRREEGQLYWSPMAIISTKSGPLAFVPPGDDAKLPTAAAADGYLTGVKPEATLVDVSEAERLVDPPKPLSTLQIIMRAEDESSQRMKTYLDALALLERSDLLIDAHSLSHRWHASTFKNTLPAQLEAIARNIPNLKKLCDEVREATAEIRKRDETPDCFSARDNDRSAPRIHPGSNLAVLNSPGEDTTAQLARRIWTLCAINLLEALLPPKKFADTTVAVTIGGKPLQYKRSEIVDFGWERAVMHLNDPTDLKPRRSPVEIEPTMYNMELTVVPIPVSPKPIRDIDYLRVLLEGDADHEHAFAPMQRLMKDISRLHAQKLLSIGDDGLELSRLGQGIITLTPLPLHSHAFGNTVIRESQALEGNVEALATFLHRAYAVYRSFYDHVRTVELEKLPKWKPKKKKKTEDEGSVSQSADEAE